MVKKIVEINNERFQVKGYTRDGRPILDLDDHVKCDNCGKLFYDEDPCIGAWCFDCIRAEQEE